MSGVKIAVISVILVLLISCVAFFTSSETAFLSLQKVKIRRMISEKKPHAKLVKKLKRNIDFLLTTVLIGTNFLNSLSSALATMLAVAIVGNGAVGVATLVISFFITTFGQIVPKTVAGLKPEEIASKSALPLMLLEKIFFPIIWLFTMLSHFVVFIFEKMMKPSANGIGNLTEEDIQTLINVGEKEGTLEKSESLMLNRIFRLDDLLVKDIMHHRSFVCMVEENATQKEVVENFLESGFSTIAVYRKSIENVVGIISYKSVLFQTPGQSFFGDEENLKNISEDEPGYAKMVMSPVILVPATMHVFDILKLFRKDEEKFAIVLDEQGGTAGVVTMKDIMKVVFGRMSDESENEEIPPENRVKVISSKELIIPGDMKIEDVNNMLSLNLESEYFNTFGGWVLEKFGVLPSVGEVMINDKNLFTVEDLSDRRITNVRVRLG